MLCFPFGILSWAWYATGWNLEWITLNSFSISTCFSFHHSSLDFNSFSTATREYRISLCKCTLRPRILGVHFQCFSRESKFIWQNTCNDKHYLNTSEFALTCLKLNLLLNLHYTNNQLIHYATVTVESQDLLVQVNNIFHSVILSALTTHNSSKSQWYNFKIHHLHCTFKFLLKHGFITWIF